MRAGLDVPQARRMERMGWLNARTLLGLLVFSAALFGGQRVLQNAENTVGVWAAARDVPEGAVISAGDLRVADVRMPSDLLSRYALASTPLEGAVATRSIAAGELFSTAWVAEDAELQTGRVISLPVQTDHAVGGALRPGDRIDILATFQAGARDARTVVLAQDVEIRDVAEAQGLIENAGQVGVTVAVDPEQAVRLAFAIRNAEIDVVRVTGVPGSLVGG
ncbi:MAG: RcpC/CpaB family pilus assembly protein, partial [Actinomycetota bacterium]